MHHASGSSDGCICDFETGGAAVVDAGDGEEVWRDGEFHHFGALLCQWRIHTCYLGRKGGCTLLTCSNEQKKSEKLDVDMGKWYCTWLNGIMYFPGIALERNSTSHFRVLTCVSFDIAAKVFRVGCCIDISNRTPIVIIPCHVHTWEKTPVFSPSNPGMDRKHPSFSRRLRSIASCPKAVAHRGVGFSAVEMTPYGMLSRVNGVVIFSFS